MKSIDHICVQRNTITILAWSWTEYTMCNYRYINEELLTQTWDNGKNLSRLDFTVCK